ncbi:integrin beta-1-A-like isoform X1 [Sycon ciliatum]|uniref:integrin beta-1-A-like isoform X1 n=1 Tax=Sycon ciliatum TaxID=27933 RepID=UPI0031F6754D
MASSATLFALVILSLCMRSVFGQPDCSSALTCDECVQRHLTCGWCTTLNQVGGTRCLPVVEHGVASICNMSFIVSPESQVRLSQPSSTPTPATGISQVDLRTDRVQNISIDLRPGAAVTFDVQIRRQNNFPVDIYYLLDTTSTFSRNRVNLLANGANIFARIGDLTPERRIGLGTFTDKPVSPYFDVTTAGVLHQVINAAISRCGLLEDGQTNCDPNPNSFVHELDVTNDVAAFSSAINRTLLANKYVSDVRKGMLDALLQSSVCLQDIGWSRFQLGESIRLVIVATNGRFHSQGDGVFGGVLRRSDGKCHLDSNGHYTETLTADYPSLGQVKSALDEADINVFFAIAEPAGVDPIVEYQTVAEDWGGRAQTARLTSNDTEFVSLVFRATQDLSERAFLQLAGDGLEGIQMSATAMCPSGSPVNPGDAVERCNGLEITKEATFRVTISAQECARLSQTRNLQLFVSPAYGRISIDINALCSCNCTSASMKNSSECSGRGDLTCGKCECPDEFPGANCSCNADQVDLSGRMDIDCRPSNAQPGEPTCNGQGICGVTDSCQVGCISCVPGYHGRYCQCSDSLCNLSGNGLPCGGNAQGRCMCDSETCGDCKCLCFPPYDMDAVCNLCPTSMETCRANQRSAVCSNNGNCVCGACQCTGGWTGQTCSACSAGASCLSEVCSNAQPCINAPMECLGRSNCTLCPGASTVSATNSENCNNHFCPANITTLETSPGATHTFYDPKNSPTFQTEGSQCTSTVGNCRITFFTASTQNQLVGIAVVRTNEEQDCDTQFNTLGVVLGIVFGLLGLAIIILIVWKIVTFVLDRREYRHFLEAQKNAKWEKESNPLFKSPTQTFVNPDYKGQPGSS